MEEIEERECEKEQVEYEDNKTRQPTSRDIRRCHFSQHLHQRVQRMTYSADVRTQTRAREVCTRRSTVHLHKCAAHIEEPTIMRQIARKP